MSTKDKKGDWNKDRYRLDRVNNWTADRSSDWEQSGFTDREADGSNIRKLEKNPEDAAVYPDEHENQAWKTHGTTRFIIFFVLFLIVILLAGMAYLNSKGIDLGAVSLAQAFSEIFTRNPVVKAGSANTVPYDNKKELLLGASLDTIIIYSGDAIVGIDKQGKEKWKAAANYIDPFGVTSDTYAVVADLNGKKLKVFKGKSKVWELETKNYITNVSINQNGYTAVASGSETAKSAIAIYDPNGTEIFTKTYAKRYVLNAQIKPDNREVLVSLVDVSGIRAFSGFEVMDIFGELKAAIMPLKQDFYPYSHFFGENAIVMAGDESIALYNRDGSERWAADFRKVHSTAFLPDGYLAAAVSKKSSTKTHLEIWDAEGHRFTSDEFGDGIVNIRCFEDIIAVNTGREVVFMNAECEQLGSYSPTADIIDIYFLNRREIAVITRNSINTYDLGVVK